MEWTLKKDLNGKWMLFTVTPQRLAIDIDLEANRHETICWLLSRVEKANIPSPAKIDREESDCGA